MIKILTILLIIVGIIFLIGLRFNRLSARIQRAEQAFENNDFQTAGEIVKGILESNNNYVPAKYIKAKLLIKQTQYVQAIYELNSILALPDYQDSINELELRSNLAVLYNETKEYKKEIEEYKNISFIEPNHIIANERLGHAMFTKKNYKPALEYLNKVDALAEHHNCSTIIGMCHYMLGDYENSEKYLLRAIRDNAENDEASYYLGSINYMRKAYTEAIPFLELSKKNNKYFVKSLYLLGTIYCEKNDYNQAITTLESGLKSLKDKNEETASYRYLLAGAFETVGKIKEATHHWEKISADMSGGYRDVREKLDSYRTIMSNANLAELFSASIEENQTLIREVLAFMQYNVVSAHKVSNSEYQYKVLNIKRPDEPIALIVYLKTARELNETHIMEFQKKLTTDKFKSGILITTGVPNIKAKATMASKKEIELIDALDLSKLIERSNAKMSKIGKVN